MIRYLLGQRVLKGVHRLGHGARCIEEFRPLEMGEVLAERRLRARRDDLEQGAWHLRPDHRCHLQQRLRLRRQAVETCRQHRLDGLWYDEPGMLPSLLHHSLG